MGGPAEKVEEGLQECPILDPASPGASPVSNALQFSSTDAAVLMGHALYPVKVEAVEEASSR